MSFLYPLVAPFISTIVVIVLAAIVMPFWSKSKFQPGGKICYITGGSSGLGKALAGDMLKQGASVTIVARDIKKLQEAEEELKPLVLPGQKLQIISADLMSSKTSSEALDQAIEFHGRIPEYIFNCAGFSQPRFLVDSTPEDWQKGLDGTYWVQAWTAFAAIKKMISHRVKGKIIFVSSFLGYTSFVGYTSYSPGKYALRGLADALRSEMLLHNVDIHIYMSAGIDSPGFVEENKTKPEITKKIEEGDSPISPEECSRLLIRGLNKNHYQIISHLVTDLMRMTSKGAVPGNNVVVDFFLWLISGPGVPVWRMITDWQIRRARVRVERDLEMKGFYEVGK
ncbi:hypothetical protein TREMEDRAFT_70510 [Tremella mesenterica DSM 1558]|uniref:uncharacterized protein n=1 Tax=Tremella mesenterica (strain ATCC 24925 / CBS 8224 / DSM 1558 / NBRC 9311 / NRRL Y-6157 / RJB 2259-6 / UBC 559-6) TaxID=578456 RepID=UPI00032BFBBE|nr:uncharacterized protein TREMEDRAFT_70510 [Tremella mesenterica DSM 1558]EIW65651.1 hypothetical protein TREMEDRAFT_70510 [Tremella mesenterica DSM 1558]